MSNDEFFRFPKTPHILWLSDLPVRDDKVLTEAERAAFLRGPVVVEEKVDGANVGLSFSTDLQVRIQNRGQWVQAAAGTQFGPLDAWLQPRLDRLFDALETTRILFGEWCYARHSVKYDRLPDWFIAFDVFDCDRRCFWSTRQRDALLRRVGLAAVPRLAHGKLLEDDLRRLLLGPSAFGAPHLEGIYLRRENTDFLEERAKLVRPEFLEQITEHWSREPLHTNRVAHEPLPDATQAVT